MGQRVSFFHQLFHSEKIRFGIVGVINTLVDFGVLVLLAIGFGAPVVVANLISTSCAMTVSFILNKRAVFKNTERNNRKQIIAFLLVTMSGIWIVQSVLIVLLNEMFEILFAGVSTAVLLLVAKAFATVASLCWNYVGYKQFVFRKSNP